MLKSLWRYLNSACLPVVGLTALLFSGTVAGDDWVWAEQHPVGSQLPEFSATDQHGERQALTELMGSKGTLIFFNRSADW